MTLSPEALSPSPTLKLLHRLRKQAAEAGSTACGSGALLGFVDITVELTRYGRLTSDEHRRQAVLAVWRSLVFSPKGCPRKPRPPA